MNIQQCSKSLVPSFDYSGNDAYSNNSSSSSSSSSRSSNGNSARITGSVNNTSNNICEPVTNQTLKTEFHEPLLKRPRYNSDHHTSSMKSTSNKANPGDSGNKTDVIVSNASVSTKIQYPFNCILCGVELYNNMENITHECEFEQKHQCQVCHKKFKLQSDLDIHARVHTDVKKPYLCDFCPQSFSTKTAYRVHVRKHTNERPFACPDPNCNATFKQKWHMLRHQRTHTGARPFVCSICDRSFAQKSSCIRHVRGIHGMAANAAKGILHSPVVQVLDTGTTRSTALDGA